MLKTIRDFVKRCLGDGKSVLALRRADGRVSPHLFTKGDDVSELELDPKYNMASVAQVLQRSGIKEMTIIGRGCDERALHELAKRFQVDRDAIEFVGLACSAEQAEECECDRPYPEEARFGDRVEGAVPKELKDVGKMSLEERFGYWREEFKRCMKCYGCKNACPVCVCDDCILEEDLWVKKGEIPPAFPMFHLIRAYHMADRCVHCHECEEACPMDIPLTLLYRQLRQDLSEMFDYLPGVADGASPLATMLEADE